MTASISLLLCVNNGRRCVCAFFLCRGLGREVFSRRKAAEISKQRASNLHAGGVARDVAEDDDGGFLAAQRRTFEEGVKAKSLEESEEQSRLETSHAEYDEAVMVPLFKYPKEDSSWKGYAVVCTARTKSLRIPCGSLVWGGYRGQMFWLVAGKVKMNRWSPFAHKDPGGPSTARCACCHRPGANSEGAEGPEAVEISYP